MPKFLQPVAIDGSYVGERTKVFNMIDNYIYLYHTDTLIAIPTFPDSVSDSMSVSFSPATMLSRSAPIQSYTGSGPRSFGVALKLHRDMMNEVNIESSNLKVDNLNDEDYVDILINQLQGCVLPRYAAAEKMVDPPVVAVRFGEDIFCKGVVTGALQTTFSGPILRTNKYAEVEVSFTINEIDPYDADAAMVQGTFRGLNSDLERRIWKVK